LGAATAYRLGAEEKAREAYRSLHGSDRGFEERLESLQSALPFRPKPFTPPKRWRGKTVLVEVFTNTENPRCLAADLAAAGLIESYPDKYLAVLEYHLAVPLPDPLADEEGQARAERYRIVSTPTAVIDGGIRMSGSGTRSMAGARYEQLKGQIDGRLSEEPDLRLKVKAVRTGDRVEATASFNRERPGAEHYLALVQDRERLKGASGTIIHRRIVRSLVRFDPAADKTVAFGLAGIDREGLRVVYFVQDMGSRRILNAAVADVTVR
jgi:thiol-disulfide isomerase/thioredoxin